VFENRVLRRIFGPKRDEVSRGWRKLNNEELRHSYSSASIIRISKLRRMRWTGYVAPMGWMRNACRILVRKSKGKRPVGRQRGMWMDNIKIDRREIEWNDMDSTDLAQDRDQWRALVNTEILGSS
jgi:hypothetical protein